MNKTQLISKLNIKGDKLRQLSDKQEEKDKQYCYKPYRTIHNY